MKRLYILNIILIIVLLSGCTTSDISGKYTYENDDTVVLHLYKDGKYFLQQDDPLGGEYYVENDKVYLLLPFESFELIIDDNGNLITSDGRVLLK